MKNITLSMDERALAAVRRYAAERDATASGLARDFLTRNADRADRARNARARIREWSAHSSGRIGAMTWKRDEPHGR